MSATLKKRLTFLVKLLITAAIFWWIFQSVDFSVMRERVNEFSALTALIFIALLLLQSIIAAARLRLLSSSIANPIPFIDSWKFSLIGLFFNQVLPSTIGGDAVKAWLIGKTRDWNLRASVHCVLIDRAYGLLALFLVIALTIPWIAMIIPDRNAVATIAVIVIIGVVGTLVFAFLPRLPAFLERSRAIKEIRSIKDTFRETFRRPVIYVLAAAYGVFSYIIAVWLIWYIGKDVGIEVDFLTCMAIVPTALLISFVPISIAGWAFGRALWWPASAMLAYPRRMRFFCR